MTAPIGGPGYVFDAESGEVIASQQQVEAMAAEYASAVAAREEAHAEIAALTLRIDALEVDLRGLVPSGARTDAGDSYLVRTPAPRPSQRVSRYGCARFSEQLLALGIGHVAYQPPGIAEVRRESARIIAAGIDLAQIAPEPVPGPDTFRVVVKAGA